MSINTNLWVERYRPQSLDEIVLSYNDRKFFEALAAKQEIPHLLFTGTAGGGKTSLSKIIINDILKCDSLYINASDENSIDVIRNKVIGFARTKSFNGNIKIVLLDECLDEDTLIAVLRNGTEQLIKIKDVIAETDLVKTYNFIKSRIEFRPFYKFDMGNKEVYEIEFENGEVVICTEDHKWYVYEDGSTLPIRKKVKDIVKENIQEIVTTI